jgi:hypothetical protein
MGFLNSLFGSKDQAGSMTAADRAIGLAKSGKISVDAMLHEISRSSITVPLASPPSVDGDRLISWHPASLSGSDGAKYFVAFTHGEAHKAFARQNPAFGYGFEVNALWVLHNLPPDHGLLLNIGATNGFEWRADRIAEFLRKVHGAA